MKNIFLLILAALYATASIAVDTLKVETKVSEVTVFFSGAQVSRQGNSRLMKGKHVILISPLPEEIDRQSLQIGNMEGCKILSVKHLLTSPSVKDKSQAVKDLESKIESMRDKTAELAKRHQVFEAEEKLLLDNSVISKKDDGAVVARIKEAADFYRTRLNEIALQKAALRKEYKQANEKIQDLYVSLNELNSKQASSFSKVLISVECERDVNIDLKMAYYITSAGWDPWYDFRVDDILKPLAIVYHANVYQSTMEDWRNVKLKLSSSNPVLSGTKPELANWYLGNPVVTPVQVRSAGGISTLQGRTYDAESNESLPFVNLGLYRNGELVANAVSDVEGNYTLKPIPPGNYLLKATYVGCKPTQVNVQMNSGKTTFMDMSLRSSAVELQEVAIVSEEFIAMPSKNINSVASTTAGVFQQDEGRANKVRGSRASENATYIDGMKAVSQNNIANSLHTNVANLEYVIDIPYTILSDGKDYSVKIKEVSLDVNYVYYVVPKLDQDVFLTAEIVNWNQLNLLSGKSSIYYQGTFTGETEIDMNQVGDTMIISLGRDKNLTVKREGNRSMYDKRFISGSIKETLGWDITVRNNKKSNVKIIVQDQFPLSQRKSIEVERLDYSGGTLEEKSGKLTWVILLAPDEKKTVTFKYSVKYPKDVNLAVE